MSTEHRAARTIGVWLAFLAVALTPLSTVAKLDPAIKCEAEKLKAAAKFASCRLKAQAKAVKKGIAPDFDKCEEKFVDKWAKIEEKAENTCPVTGDASSVRAMLEECTAKVQPGGVLCPSDMVATELACMDRYEAPNQAGELPLVMYTLDEAEAWCTARGKRLCFDDEWENACEGATGTAYPYGDTHQPGLCNDEETWIAYNQSLIDAWPFSIAGPTIGSLAELLATARSVSASASDSADHIEALYQGETSGSNVGCASDRLIFDLTGNVEEWTRRRDGGTPGFAGNLKGRYWAEARTCQSNVTSHGDFFRFYELGFRCCTELP